MNLTYSVSKLSCCFLYLCALPVALEIDYILKIWLGDSVPEHTNTFVILIILTSFVNNLNAAISGVIHASGKMMVYQTVTSAISIMCVPTAYLGLKLGSSPEFALLMVFCWATISQIASIIILKSIISYSMKDYFRKVIWPLFALIVLTIWPSYFVRLILDEGILRFLVVGFVSVFVSMLGIYFIALNKSEKELINGFLLKFKKIWQK